MQYQKMPNLLDVEEVTNVAALKKVKGKYARLSLQNRKATSLPKGIVIPEQVEHFELDLSYNKKLDQDGLIDELLAIDNLRGLGLIKNEFKELTEKIGELTKLESLILWSNGLHELPNSFSQLENLRYLHLRNNHLKTFPKEVCGFSKLEHLNLRFNKFKKIPKEFFQLKHIKSLDLSSCSLASLTEEIGNFTELESLSLESNQIKVLPKGLANCQNLREVHLKGNKNLDLGQAFEVLSQIKSFKKLNLAEWKLTELPENIGKMVHLEEVDISNNLLTSLPESLGSLPNLQNLNFEKNALDPEQVFPVLAQIQSLKELNLNHFNCFGNAENTEPIPESIGLFSQLEVLDLSYAKGVALLPDSIKNCKGLKRLRVVKTKLQKLPEGLGELEGLEDLSVYNNAELGTIPESIYQLNNLKRLHFRGNGAQLEVYKLNGSMSLEHLSVDKVSDEEFTHFSNYKALKVLSWNSDELTELPDSFFDVALEEFSFWSFPKLDEDSALQKLAAKKTVRTLKFHYQNLHDFNWYIERLQAFSELEEVQIYVNEKKIPAELVKLSFIKQLKIEVQTNYDRQAEKLSFPLNFAQFASGDQISFTRYSKTALQVKDILEKLGKVDGLSDQKKQLGFGLFMGYFDKLDELLENPFQQSADLAGITVFVAGKPSGSTLTALRKELTERGAKVAKKLDAKVTHVMVTPSTKEEMVLQILAGDYSIFLEDHLKNQQIKENTPYLMEEGGEELTEQITRLMKVQDEDNTALLLELIEGGGANKLLLSYLLAIHLFHNDNDIRRKSRNLFKKYASSEFQSSVKNHWKNSFRDKNIDQFKLVYNHPEVDVCAFILAFKMVRWHQMAQKNINYYRHNFVRMDGFPKEAYTDSLAEWDFCENLIIELEEPLEEEFLYEKLKNLPLKELTLSYPMTEYPVRLASMEHLESLTIGKWGQDEKLSIPETTLKNPALKRLTFSYSSLINTNALAGYSNVERLYFSNCKLDSLDFLASLKEVSDLNLTACNLTELPAAIQSYSKLEHLRIGDNHIEKLDINFSQFKKLQSLYADNCKLNYIADTFHDCNNLEDVHISNNELEVLPASLFKCESKWYSGKRIIARKNKIKSIGGNTSGNRGLLKSISNIFSKSEGADPAKKIRLRALDLMENQLEEVPPILWELEEIDELKLDQNPIKTFPADFKKLKVSRISLDETEISTFPLQLFDSEVKQVTLPSLDKMDLPDPSQIPAYSKWIYCSGSSSLSEKSLAFKKVLDEKREQ
ncbi:leucine-rich repeat protein [Flammeovirgaceae bacterium SG7u.111]|nr:leucine-rich repeat protein [Flammeovirgaceae bacterium SG7u.132]WPO36023.1 leucine-rich repeat protein [Flammeovirgaceae bacterium SG7u.111]